jgi:hypothetical protein
MHLLRTIVAQTKMLAPLGFLILAGCTAADRSIPVPSQLGPGDTMSLERDNLTVEISIPETEPASAGTYELNVTPAGGSAQFIVGEREGAIACVWIYDVGGDAGPEIIVWMVSAGSGSYGTLHLYEYDDDQYSRRELVFPPIDERWGYMGHDTFEVRSGKLLWEYPIYLEGDPNAAPGGGRASFCYSFGEDRWVEE